MIRFLANVSFPFLGLGRKKETEKNNVLHRPTGRTSSDSNFSRGVSGVSKSARRKVRRKISLGLVSRSTVPPGRVHFSLVSRHFVPGYFRLVPRDRIHFFVVGFSLTHAYALFTKAALFNQECGSPILSLGSDHKPTERALSLTLLVH